MNSILEVKNLTKHYNTFSLKDVNLSVPKGSIVGFIGENGAGKTTTIKAIIGAIQKDQGEVLIFDKPFNYQEKEIKQQMALVMEGSFFHDELTPKQIAKVLRGLYRKWNDSTFEGYLKRFKVPFDKKVKEFSKGMRMKLSLSIALSYDVKLLILDEPTSGLDPVVRSEILTIFQEFIEDEERSILMSTHITTDLEKIADYITFIHEGEIVWSKSKDELIYEYGVLKCRLEDFKRIDPSEIVGFRKNQFNVEALVANKQLIKNKYPDLLVDPATIEEIMLYYVGGEKR